MARMIPPVISADTKSYAEIEIFKRLKDEPTTKDWIVLHSFDLSKHVKRMSGEIDFLVIIPNFGVLCVEVKGCKSVKREEGLWYYGQNSSGDHRGPFKQVDEAMHSLRENIASDRPHLARVPFFSCVIFPYLTFTIDSQEWHEWEVIDRPKFKANQLGNILKQTANKWRDHAIAKDSTKKMFYSNEPYLEQCDELAAYLRENFEIHENARATIESLERELIRFTSEQFEVLDVIQSNPRILVQGAAGTGKTHLALEAVRRANLSGKKTLFLCYNKNLAEWLKEKTAEYPNVTTTSLHSYMLSFAKVKPSGEDFWAQTLPQLAQEEFFNTFTPESQFDLVIIDEGQDMFSSNYLDFIDLLLRGGFSSGNWMIFGDFLNQRIYNVSNITVSDFQKQRAIDTVDLQLSINCRNLPSIGSWAQLFGNLRPGYSKYRRPGLDIEPDIIYFQNQSEQHNLLLTELEKLSSQGFSNKDIIILSPKNQEHSRSAEIENPVWKSKIKPFNITTSDNCIRYASISSFKGLESPIIIVTDVNNINSEIDLTNLYIAISRSTLRVTLLVATESRKEIVELITKRLIK